ncbi:MAG: potassium-transporting ATPase subunit C [Collinsella sp.]|nr:potassium-transporting ATPase subunit C [Collinsella sp.]
MFKGVASRALSLFAFFSVLCGVAYTLVVTGIAQAAFPYQANGSIIVVDGKEYGSELIGQRFEDMDHMWGRIQDLSVVEGEDGELAVYSAASNRTPASDYSDRSSEERFGDSYQKTVEKRVAMIREANPDADADAIPVDLVTSSASGLDPHISLAAAEYQIPRLVEWTGKSEEEIRSAVEAAATHKFLGLFGEDVVNVLKVNLILDGIIEA